MATPHDLARDAFGRLIVDPNALSHRARIDVLRRVAGELQAANSREARWLGQQLIGWLHDGGDLAQRLGVRPTPGSRATPQATVRIAERDARIRRLVVAVGSQARAARILQGAEPAPARAAALAAELLEMGAPRSRRAIVRACARAGAGRGAP